MANFRPQTVVEFNQQSIFGRLPVWQETWLSRHFFFVSLGFSFSALIESVDPATYDILRQAEVFESQRRPDLAIPLLRKVIGRDPRAIVAFAMLAYALRSEGQYDEAIGCARRCVELRPDIAYSHSCLATMFAAAANFQGAIDASMEAVRLDPSKAWHYWPAASGCIELRQFDRAIEICRRGLAVNPAQIQLKHHLGLALAGGGYADEAITVTAEYLLAAPDNSMSHCVAGWSYWYLGRLDEAAVFFQQALRIDPKFPWQHEGLGVVRFDQGRWTEARELLREAGRLDSAMDKGRVVLAEIDRRIGDYPDGDFPSGGSRELFA